MGRNSVAEHSGTLITNWIDTGSIPVAPPIKYRSELNTKCPDSSIGHVILNKGKNLLQKTNLQKVIEFLEQDPLLLEMLEDVLFFEPGSRDIPFSQPKKLLMR